MVKPDDEGPPWPRPLRMGHMCQYRPRYHLIYDPQRHDILLTGEQSTTKGPSISFKAITYLPNRYRGGKLAFFRAWSLE